MATGSDMTPFVTRTTAIPFSLSSGAASRIYSAWSVGSL